MAPCIRKVGCVCSTGQGMRNGDTFLLKENKVIESSSKAGYFRMRKRGNRIKL